MAAFQNIQLKSIALLAFLAFSFTASHAQRRGEYHNNRGNGHSEDRGRPGYGNRHFDYGDRGGNYRRYPSDYRRPYSHYNPSWRYNCLPARRSYVRNFNFAYQTINYRGCGYRYYGGTFYRPYNNAFVVVAPPIGLSINILPAGYRRVYVHNDPYYYYNGTFYNQYQDEYRVVAPPVGALVESIPEGYETITIDGETYYQVDGIQYKPVVQANGEIWYEVIKVN